MQINQRFASLRYRMQRAIDLSWKNAGDEKMVQVISEGGISVEATAVTTVPPLWRQGIRRRGLLRAPTPIPLSGFIRSAGAMLFYRS